jgi:hypothetical protein
MKGLSRLADLAAWNGMTYLRIVIRSNLLFEHDFRANALRLSRGKTGSQFYALVSQAETRDVCRIRCRRLGQPNPNCRQLKPVGSTRAPIGTRQLLHGVDQPQQPQGLALAGSP